MDVQENVPFGVTKNNIGVGTTLTAAPVLVQTPRVMVPTPFTNIRAWDWENVFAESGMRRGVACH